MRTWEISSILTKCMLKMAPMNCYKMLQRNGNFQTNKTESGSKCEFSLSTFPISILSNIIIWSNLDIFYEVLTKRTWVRVRVPIALLETKEQKYFRVLRLFCVFRFIQISHIFRIFCAFHVFCVFGVFHVFRVFGVFHVFCSQVKMWLLSKAIQYMLYNYLFIRNRQKLKREWPYKIPKKLHRQWLTHMIPHFIRFTRDYAICKPWL